MSCLVVQTSCNYFLFKGNFRETTTFEDSDRRASVRTSGGLGSEEESETVETHDRQRPPLGKLMTMIH